MLRFVAAAASSIILKDLNIKKPSRKLEGF
jgi:hypothetical protein